MFLENYQTFSQWQKCNRTFKIYLAHNGNIISDDFEWAKTFKNSFNNAVGDLGIKQRENDLDIDIPFSDVIYNFPDETAMEPSHLCP